MKKTMNEQLYDTLQYLGAATILVTFIIGVLTIIVGKKLNAEKDKQALAQQERIAEINRQVEEESHKRLEAEIRLLELQQKVSWRTIDREKFTNALKEHKSKGHVQIVFPKEDNESYLLASAIQSSLTAAGWEVENLISNINVKDKDADIPFLLKQGGIIATDFNGVVIVTSAPERSPEVLALLGALEKCGLNYMETTPHEAIRPSGALIRIIVGPRL